MITVYRTTPDSVTWDVDGRRPLTSSAVYLAGRKACLVRTGGDEHGCVYVGEHKLDESQIDILLDAIKIGTPDGSTEVLLDKEKN